MESRRPDVLEASHIQRLATPIGVDRPSTILEQLFHPDRVGQFVPRASHPYRSRPQGGCQHGRAFETATSEASCHQPRYERVAGAGRIDDRDPRRFHGHFLDLAAEGERAVAIGDSDGVDPVIEQAANRVGAGTDRSQRSEPDRHDGGSGQMPEQVGAEDGGYTRGNIEREGRPRLPRRPESLDGRRGLGRFEQRVGGHVQPVGIVRPAGASRIGAIGTRDADHRPFPIGIDQHDVDTGGLVGGAHDVASVHPGTDQATQSSETEVVVSDLSQDPAVEPEPRQRDSGVGGGPADPDRGFRGERFLAPGRVTIHRCEEVDVDVPEAGHDRHVRDANRPDTLPSVLVQIYTAQSVDEAEALVEAGVDHVGVTISDRGLPGEIDLTTGRAIVDSLRGSARSVALTVETDPLAVRAFVAAVRPDIVHLCGSTTEFPPAEVADLKDWIGRRRLPVEVMQAIPVTGEEAVGEARRFAHHADWLILDSYTDEVEGIGAAGETHDWSISRAIVESVEVPVILAGGLDPDNVAEAIRAVGPAGVDSLTGTNRPVGGGFEKDLAAVRRFVEEARRAAQVT